jgi:hypothetical protein
MENPQDLITVGLLAQLCQVFAVMACTLGKSAFAITLLRIMTQRWIIYTIWFILITMNLVNILTCFFVFLQCKTPEHLWNPAVPSECWDPSVFTNFSLFVGCKSIFVVHIDGTKRCVSILWLSGLCLSFDSVVRHYEASDEEKGEGGYCTCDEYGNLVSSY